jgi:hypothetical protein
VFKLLSIACCCCCRLLLLLSPAAAVPSLQEGNEFPDAKKVTVRGSPDNVASAKAQIKQVRHVQCMLAGQLSGMCLCCFSDVSASGLLDC